MDDLTLTKYKIIYILGGYKYQIIRTQNKIDRTETGKWQTRKCCLLGLEQQAVGCSGPRDFSCFMHSVTDHSTTDELSQDPRPG